MDPRDPYGPDEPMRGQVLVTAEQIAAAVGLRPGGIWRLVRLGLVQPIRPDEDRFAAETLIRLARMLRLSHDLGMRLEDAAIIVDLVERLDQLEAELARMRAAFRGSARDLSP